MGYIYTNVLCIFNHIHVQPPYHSLPLTMHPRRCIPSLVVQYKFSYFYAELMIGIGISHHMPEYLIVTLTNLFSLCPNTQTYQNIVW